MDLDQSTPDTHSARTEIAFGCDAGYLQPLTIAISSVLTSARNPGKLRFWLVTKSLDEKALSPLRKIIERVGAQLETRIPVPDAAVEKMPLGEHFTEATYYRLMLPQLVPAEVSKLIYLDSDIIVRHPIEELWNTNLGQLSTGAVWNPRPLNHERLGLSREADYFNAGVLLMNLERWRNQGIHTRAMRYAIEPGRELPCADQDALNHVLAGAWKRLDLRWNQQTKFFDHSSGYLRVPWLTLRRARSAPYIVHYSTNTKPWHTASNHPWRDLYFEQLDRTHYRGWRPAAPPPNAHAAKRRSAGANRRWQQRARALKSLFTG